MQFRRLNFLIFNAHHPPSWPFPVRSDLKTPKGIYKENKKCKDEEISWKKRKGKRGKTDSEEKCTKPHALTAEKNAKFPSSLLETDLFIAGTVIKSTGQVDAFN